MITAELLVGGGGGGGGTTDAATAAASFYSDIFAARGISAQLVKRVFIFMKAWLCTKFLFKKSRLNQS